ncbi:MULTISPECIES: hypothetical protein [unclassified Janthinobacterium]|uniref:hypothetical protein n=1 Tax=unclassified Janthinobacterium TaxID=2610881 RepID=UPI001E33FDEF|nr:MULTISPECIES: hypothetical protein [unclassified Janthinobacterium]MCC7644645.1 hypothetical protein [Janthinobacterium sp. EB271-G4-3-1]MCC7692610.1 hypothetical protein [Janthinobacterium sp. EB271-G4-3-2]
MSNTSNTRRPAGNVDTGTIDEAVTEAAHAPAAPSLARQLADTLATSATGLRFNIAQDTFQEAYASLLDAVPRDDRPALLAQMRRDLDIVAERELSMASGNDAQTGRVSTRQFMRGLEEQERQQREKDVASHSLLSGPELRARLAVTPQALSAALKARRLFALRGASGEYVYPAFFADPRHDRHTLEKISKILGDLPGPAKWDFFTVPRLSLGGKSPLEALAKGKLDAVMAAARAYADE